MSKVSVVIPMYNTEEFIEHSIKSVINQSYKNIEIIIVNDGSEDDSQYKVKRLMEVYNNIKLFNFEKNKGVGAARNYGIKHATGDYIYFLDSDDFIPEKTLELLINNIKNQDVIRGRMRGTNLSNSFVVVFNGLFNVRYFTENRFNLLKHSSATNFLIRKKFIIENELGFSENINAYSDLYFMIPLLKKIDTIPYLNEAVYFKRKRNDPILNPALTQRVDVTIAETFLTVYLDLKSTYKSHIVQSFLDRHLLNYYRKHIIAVFKDEENIDKLFSLLNQSIQKVQPEMIKASDYILKTELRPIQKNNIRKYKRINKRHRFLRNFKEGLKSKRKMNIFLYQHVFTKLPLKKKLVFFESFLGKSYSDSPKYIYEYMLNNNKNYKYVWCFRETKKIPGNHIQVKRFSLRYFYYLARSKYWVSNSRLPKYLNKREGNIYLQTWHGTPLKTLVFDIKDIYSADPNYKLNFYEQSRRWDYLNSPNAYSTEIFKRAFQYDKQMLEYGYPRNDILYNKNEETYIQKLKNNLNIPPEKKVILYAPTWRDDQYFSRGNYKFALNLELEKMQEKLSDDYILVLRTHYHISNSIDVSEYKGFVYDLSNYDDIAELYLISDMLITDYSSVFFDYANLKRPILFYTYDLENYRDKLRGLYFDLEKEVPGPILMTTDEVIQAVENIESINVEYKEKYNAFYERFCSWDNGLASQNTYNKVFNDE